MKPSNFLAITSVLANSYNDKYNTDDFKQNPDIKKFGESKMSHKS